MVLAQWNADAAKAGVNVRYNAEAKAITGVEGAFTIALTDGGSVQAVIDKLRDLSASKFSETAGGASALVVTVTYGEKKKVEKVTINKSGEEYFAQRENDNSIYVIDKAAFEDLRKAISGIKPAAPPAPPATKK